MFEIDMRAWLFPSSRTVAARRRCVKCKDSDAMLRTAQHATLESARAVDDRHRPCWGLDDYKEVSAPYAEGGTRFARFRRALITRARCERTARSLLGSDQYSQVSGPNADGATDIIQVVTGFEGRCLPRGDGSATCWGNDYHGRLSGPSADSGGDLTALGLDMFHACGIRGDGSMTCWGHDVRLSRRSRRRHAVARRSGAVAPVR